MFPNTDSYLVHLFRDLYYFSDSNYMKQVRPTSYTDKHNLTL